MIMDWFFRESFSSRCTKYHGSEQNSLKFLNNKGKRGIVPLKYEAKVFGGQVKVAPNGRDWRICHVKLSQKYWTAVEKLTKLRHCHI